MSEESSELPALQQNRVDRLTAIAKGLVGGLPIIGPVVAEAIGVLIPQQRMDRIADVLERVEGRLSDVEAEMFEKRIRTDVKARDLFEEGITQATRAVSEERRERIASLMKMSLTKDELEYQERERLWKILEELNDVELLILQWKGLQLTDGADDFWEQHKDVITGPHVHMGSSPEEIDTGAVYKSYQRHLVELGLIRPRFKRPKKGELPEFDEKTGMMKASSHELTRLGHVFLRYLELPTRL